MWYGTTKAETARWAAQHLINIACVGKTKTIRAITDAYRTQWKTPTHIIPLLGLVRIVVIAPSDADARALTAPAYARWFETFTFLSRTHDLPIPPNLPKSFEEAVDDGFCVVGSPSTVEEALKRQVVQTGVTYRMCQVAFGDLPLAASLQTISAIGKLLVPHFATMDRWRTDEVLPVTGRDPR